MKSNNKTRKVIFGFAIALILVTLSYFLPFSKKETQKAEALTIFTPFGGKVESWNPVSEACMNQITIPLATATFGTVWLTVDELKVGGPTPATLGILRLYGVQLIPPPVPILNFAGVYEWFNFYTPEVWTLGDSINICGVCGKIEDIPAAAEICNAISSLGNGTDEVSGDSWNFNIVNCLCGAVSGDLSQCANGSETETTTEGGESGEGICPITNLVLKIGTGLVPDVGE
ncbi:hypothetical protein A3A09_01360 [Candidatus Nomurabacteria bacterium RIFCSPLOWO2_01_FULL_42_20]|uniref:Uncharacterized protein n=1 Tax=Candidatus Nomurabacteria bacterium RIFCSPHIGHO2_01_FULL_42_16 TaxID=1801743 RepID=A0A1F6VHA3_9BACT|nr:MAG: hypothetical protein A2824_00485 [Candidatus Nomurabacteria bacterium RIFCSPHIGHO2_01_FULL_42_16]OGI92384.1 MAG: hypothetical protein A3A09_01360 [Candidatus Nomurabacteria bacterium RIFCSPLOWO2_01_FULL_42_20]